MSNRNLSIINIRSILGAFHKSVVGYTSLFYVTPWIIGIIMPIILWNANEKATNAFNAFLTSFVPLFATILTFYISWCYNKIKTRHNEERLNMFRETSTNILMMIPLDVLALLLYVFASNQWLSGVTILDNSAQIFGYSVSGFLTSITWHHTIRYVFLVGYYAAITEIVLIVLMVCKRAYKIINNEITLLDERLIDDPQKE